MRHMWKRLVQTALTLVVTASLALSGNVSAMAAGNSGTLKIQPKYGNDLLTKDQYDGTFDVYKVADYDPAKPTLTYVAPFASYNDNSTYSIESLSGEDKDTVFRQLVEAIREDYNNGAKDSSDLQKSASGIGAEGSASLSYGLYLIVQNKSASGYNDVAPFLVFLPEATGYYEDAAVTAYPKVSKPSTPPDNPPGGGDNPPGDNPPGGDNPPSEDEGGEEETPETPVIDEIGTDEEIGEIEEIGGRTGDDSQMMTYGAVAGVAAVALVGWFVWKKRQNNK